VCFEYLIPYTRVDINLNDKCNPPALLSALRTLRHLVGRVSTISLKNEMTTLLPLFHRALCHKSMDMRKATVFALVEMYIALGEDLDIDGFSDCQRRLIDVYVERHPNRSQMMT
jgi:CLIP-associating protein 1/2